VRRILRAVFPYRGTEGSNPSPSSDEPDANPVGAGRGINTTIAERVISRGWVVGERGDALFGCGYSGQLSSSNTNTRQFQIRPEQRLLADAGFGVVAHAIREDAPQLSLFGRRKGDVVVFEIDGLQVTLQD
jgi:hypothetical protein